MEDTIQRPLYVKTLAETFETTTPPLVLKTDNMPTITMVNAFGSTKQSKFIELRHQYIKQKIQSNNIIIKHVPSRILLSDMFTKPLERQ